METGLPLGELQQMMRAGDVINTRPAWDDVLESFRYNTVLTGDQERRFKGIFRRMAGSSVHTNAFIRAVSASMMARPRVTRRFLEQVLPPQFFPRSLHMHAGWKNLAFILDYLRYLLIGAPTKRFGQQLAQYVEPRSQQYHSTRSSQQQYYSARSSLQQAPQQLSQGSSKAPSPHKQKIPQTSIQQQYPSIVRYINNKLFGQQRQRKQQLYPQFYFQLLQRADKIRDDVVYEDATNLIKLDMQTVFDIECSAQRDFVVEHLRNGLRMTCVDFGHVYLALNEMQGCDSARGTLFATARLIFMEILRRKGGVDLKEIEDVLNYLSRFHSRYRTAYYLWHKKKDVVYKVLEVMGCPVPELSWNKVVALVSKM